MKTNKQSFAVKEAKEEQISIELSDEDMLGITVVEYKGGVSNRLFGAARVALAKDTRF